jgi:hypothetical protein
MNRQEWAIARETMRRQQRACTERGHIVVRIGPYLICRTLRCRTLVVGLAS